jgi:putative phosphoribosyl transferase
MFRNRMEAGRKLSEKLSTYRSEHPLVIALPRGGVPVAKEVAAALDAPWDVLVVCKLGVPARPELSMGAVAEDGAVYLDQGTLNLADLTEYEVGREVREAEAEIVRRAALYRHGRPRLSVQGRTVILIDDGIATGGTIRAALKALASAGAGKVVLASPVVASGVASALRPLVVEIVCLEDRPRLGAINRAYRDFKSLRDTDVVALLDAPPSGGQGVRA